MSIMMYVLADKHLSKKEVFDTLQECGMDVSTFKANRNNGLSGNFPLENGYVSIVSYCEHADYQSIEDKEWLESDLGIQWLVDSVILFDFRLTEHSTEILAHFVEVLAQKTKAYFNYSFQREVTYAVKDEKGFRWLEASKPTQ